MNTARLNSAISEFMTNRKMRTDYYKNNWDERISQKEFYQAFTREKLLTMTEEEFLEYISKLWSMIIWGNKQYVVDKLIADNGFDNLKKQLVELLYGNAPVEKRWDSFLKTVKGLGPATISELLTYATVSYTHLDVYKRQVSGLVTFSIVSKSVKAGGLPARCWETY